MGPSKFELGFGERMLYRGAILFSVLSLGGVLSACGDSKGDTPVVPSGGIESTDEQNGSSDDSTDEASGSTDTDASATACNDEVSDEYTCRNRGNSEEALGVESEEIEGRKMATVESSEAELELLCAEALRESGQVVVLPIFASEDPESDIMDYYYC